MTDAEKIELLRAKLEETLSENDRLRALVANLTEGANAHQTLQSLYRNVDLPESLRAKCAIGALDRRRSLPSSIADFLFDVKL